MLGPAAIPNLICVVRMLLIAPIVWVLLDGRYGAGVALVALAAFSDGLDGFLAKRFGWQTRLGGILDPLADKLLLASLFVALAALELVPVWLTVLVIGRDLVIVSGGLAFNFLVGPVQPEPSVASKLNTLLQLLFVLLVLLREAAVLPLQAIVLACGAGVVVTSLVSGFDYVMRWSARAIARRA